MHRRVHPSRALVIRADSDYAPPSSMAHEYTSRQWRLFRQLGSVLLLAMSALPLAGQQRTASRDWPTYGGDLRSTRYSPLDQINAGNFKDLEIAWRFKTDNLGPRPEFNLQATPLVVNGTLYSTGGTRRAAFALDAATGELKWVYSLDEGKRAAASPRQLSARGVGYWTDGTQGRIFYVTTGYTLIALDSRTGRPIPTFGQGGMVDLKKETGEPVDPTTGDLGLHAAPLIAKDVIVIGAALSGGQKPKSRKNDKGVIRGYDVRTGKRLWTFNTIPGPGEPGNETWLKDSWAYTGNAGAWAQMSVDEELGQVYVPTESATGDAYGGHRHGANLFTDSLVALDIRTGRRVWHFQMVHHDIWDYDLPCAPILADLVVEGRRIKAVAQPTKQGFVYVFDRTTGRPVWPIEERPVPKGDIASEWYSPTQPFPTRPPAFERQGGRIDDLIDFTPELKAQAAAIVSKYKIGPLFTPPVISRREGPLGLLMVPQTSGGANWPGGALDPDTNILYLFSNNSSSLMSLIRDPNNSDMDYIQGLEPGPDQTVGPIGSDAVQLPGGLPLFKPPWGRISAIDLNKGEIVWQIPHGETADNVRNHPLLKGVTIPRTGRPGRIGTLVTKTLVIAGDGGIFTTPSGRRGAMLRAYDKATGREIGEVFMPAPQTGSPMTYMLDGRQFIVVAVSGGAYSGELLAFTLPKN
jgi:quinoprotein glucose dehydrogenase